MSEAPSVTVEQTGAVEQDGAAERKLTDEQRAAIFAKGVSIGLSAGAGCGKTFVLTERFLSHLVPGGSGCETGDTSGGRGDAADASSDRGDAAGESLQSSPDLGPAGEGFVAHQRDGLVGREVMAVVLERYQVQRRDGAIGGVGGNHVYLVRC